MNYFANNIQILKLPWLLWPQTSNFPTMSWVNITPSLMKVNLLHTESFFFSCSLSCWSWFRNTNVEFSLYWSVTRTCTIILLVVILWNHLLDFVCLPFWDQAHNIWKTSPASVLLAAFPDLDCMFPAVRKKALGSAIVWLAASERRGAAMTARNSLLTCGPWAKGPFYLFPVYLSKLGWPCQEARCHVSVFCRASSTEREEGNDCGHQVEQLRPNQHQTLWHWSESSLEES